MGTEFTVGATIGNDPSIYEFKITRDAQIDTFEQARERTFRHLLDLGVIEHREQISFIGIIKEELPTTIIRATCSETGEILTGPICDVMARMAESCEGIWKDEIQTWKITLGVA